MNTVEFLRDYKEGRRDFTGENLRKFYLAGITLDQCDFRGADLTAATLHSCSVEGADFSWANLRAADLSFCTALVMRAEFRGALLVSANFRYARLSASCFAGSVALMADFTGADLDGADFTSAVVKGRRWSQGSDATIRPDTVRMTIRYGEDPAPLFEERWRNGNAGPWRESIVGGWEHWAKLDSAYKLPAPRVMRLLDGREVPQGAVEKIAKFRGWLTKLTPNDPNMPSASLCASIEASIVSGETLEVILPGEDYEHHVYFDPADMKGLGFIKWLVNNGRLES